MFLSNLFFSLRRHNRLALLPSVALGLACTSDPGEGVSNTSDPSAGDEASGTGGVTITTGVTMTTADSDGSTTSASETTSAEVTTSDSADESTNDGSADESGETGRTVEEVSIYEIRDGTVPSGTDVVVRGVLVTAVGPNGFFAQETDGGPHSAVWVYAGNNGPDITALAIGDEVDFVGFTGVHFGLTQVAIYNGSVDVTSSPNPAPAPETVALAVLDDPAQAEAWESVLVRVEGEGLTVTAINQFDEITIEDDQGAAVMIDKLFYNLPEDIFDLTIGDTFSAVQGPLNYSFDNYKIAPREANDVEGYTPAE
jgi:uncharacterized protein